LNSSRELDVTRPSQSAVAYLTVVLEPLGGNFGDSVVLLSFTLGHTCHGISDSFAHGLEELGGHIFLQIGCLFYRANGTDILILCKLCN